MILHEKTNAGNDNADGFEKPFVAMGGKVLAKIDFGRDVNDFTAIATRIASLGKVDVLPTFALEGQTVRLSQALAQAKIVKGGGGSAVQMGSIWLPYGFDQKAGQAARATSASCSSTRPRTARSCRTSSRRSAPSTAPTRCRRTSTPMPTMRSSWSPRPCGAAPRTRSRCATAFSKMKDVEVTTGKITFDAKGQNSDLSVVHFVETQKDLSWKGLNWR